MTPSPVYRDPRHDPSPMWSRGSWTSSPEGSGPESRSTNDDWCVHGTGTIDTPELFYAPHVYVCGSSIFESGTTGRFSPINEFQYSPVHP